jgi:hypothetical protein
MPDSIGTVLADPSRDWRRRALRDHQHDLLGSRSERHQPSAVSAELMLERRMGPARVVLAAILCLTRSLLVDNASVPEKRDADTVTPLTTMRTAGRMGSNGKSTIGYGSLGSYDTPLRTSGVTGM